MQRTFNSLAAAAACSASLYCSESVMTGKKLNSTIQYNYGNTPPKAWTA
jgi:hypothetical protein